MNNNATYQSLYYEPGEHFSVHLEEWSRETEWINITFYVLTVKKDGNTTHRLIEGNKSDVIRQAIAEFDELKARYFPEGEQ